MVETDKPQFVAILNGLAAVKPNAKLTKEAYEIWWNAMADWSIEDFRAGASHLALECQFMPTPYDFNQLRKAGELTAHEAWAFVLSGKPLEPGSVMERAADAVGGQKYIRMANIETTLPHVQRRFLDAHEEIREAATARKVSVLRLGSEDSKAALARISARMEPETVGLLRQDR